MTPMSNQAQEPARVIVVAQGTTAPAEYPVRAVEAARSATERLVTIVGAPGYYVVEWRDGAWRQTARRGL